jgi:hypothetical protein
MDQTAGFGCVRVSECREACMSMCDELLYFIHIQNRVDHTVCFLILDSDWMEYTWPYTDVRTWIEHRSCILKIFDL